MPKVKISEFDIDPANNTDINSINIAEGCAPSGINNAIRQLMSDLKEFQTGGAGDPFNGAVNGTVGATTANTGAFTTLSASGVTTVSAGTVSAPAITTTGDTNTGIFFPAADTIAFTEGGVESMRIDASGNVGIGTASPDVKLNVFNGSVRVSNTTTGLSSGFTLGLNSNDVFVSNQANGYMLFGTNNSERMRITAAGDIGIGTGSPAAKLDVGGAITDTVPATYKGTIRVNSATQTTVEGVGGIEFPVAADGYGYKMQQISSSGACLAFAGRQGSATWTERMRIDSSGNLMVGTTSALNSGKVVSYQSSSSTTGYGFRSDTATAAGTGWGHFYGTSSNNTAANILIYGNGNIANANGSYAAFSDIKLKENIVDATPKLDKICKVRVVNYTLKQDVEQQSLIGVIAQELEQVFPSLVEEAPDRDAEGNDLGTTTKSVKYSVFVPMLIKAIQEQQAIITDLKARIETLESK